MDILLNKLKPKSEFSRNVLTLMTGTTIAQAIPIAISPILTRIYTPEDFGMFALYMGIVSFVAIIVTARYELAIVLPKTDENAINILALSLLIMLAIVSITFLSILLFKDNILELLNAKSIGNFIYLIPFSILLSGLYQSFNYWANRKEYFRTMSSSQVLQSVSIGVSQPSLGYLNIFGGLILGNFIGRVVSVFVLINKFLKHDKSQIININKIVMVEQMKKYKDFPFINSFHAFSDVIRVSGSVMLISSFWGTTILGFYALSLRALQVPVGIIGSALGQVLYQKFSLIYNNGENLLPYVKSIIFKLLAIALPLFLVLFFIAPSLFSFVFGEEWRVAGEYTQILIPYLFMNFLISPISQIPIILGKQKEIFYISLFGNILYILVFILLYKNDIFVTLIVLSISQFLFYMYVAYWYFMIIKRYDNE